MTTSQMQLMITTKRQFFMKAKNSQVSLILCPTRVSNAKCCKHKCKYMQINEDFLKSKGRYYMIQHSTMTKPKELSPKSHHHSKDEKIP
jgi:hypothetical protein